MIEKQAVFLIKREADRSILLSVRLNHPLSFFIIRFQQSYHLIHQKLLVVFLLQKSQRCQHQIFQLNHLVGLPAKIHKIFPVLVQDPDPDQMYRNPFLLYCYWCYLLLYQRMYSLIFLIRRTARSPIAVPTVPSPTIHLINFFNSIVSFY